MMNSTEIRDTHEFVAGYIEAGYSKSDIMGLLDLTSEDYDIIETWILNNMDYEDNY